jgi:hypothetical protein
MSALTENERRAILFALGWSDGSSSYNLYNPYLTSLSQSAVEKVRNLMSQFEEVAGVQGAGGASLLAERVGEIIVNQNLSDDLVYAMKRIAMQIANITNIPINSQAFLGSSVNINLVPN